MFQNLRNFRRSKKLFGQALFILSAFAMWSLFAGSLCAITVTNTTTDTILFADDFESAPSVGSLAFPDHTGDHDPDNGLLPGFWSISEPDVAFAGDRQGNVQVINRTDSPDPGPSQGMNYLRIGREDADSNPGTDAMFDIPATSGQTIFVDLMFATNHSGNSSNGGIYLRGTTTTSSDAHITTTSFTPGGTVRNNNGLGQSNSGLSYNPSGWNRLMIEYTVGATEFTLWVNGESQVLSTRASEGGFGADVTSITMVRTQGHHQGVQLYLDAVPEPLPGDLNGDGMVNAADYVFWRDTGTGDFQEWFSNFGAASEAASTSAATAVPEPASICLVFVAMFIAFGTLRRR